MKYIRNEKFLNKIDIIFKFNQKFRIIFLIHEFRIFIHFNNIK